MIEIDEKEWPGLSTLLGAYFHQDYDLLYGGPDETIEEFANDEPPDLVAQAAREARTLAHSTADEEALRGIVVALELSYVPWRDGWTCREWLLHVAEILETRNPEPGTTR